MQKYLTQLLSDIETAILIKWRISPPHYYEMGMLAESWIEPPKGYNGPPLGAITDILQVLLVQQMRFIVQNKN